MNPVSSIENPLCLCASVPLCHLALARSHSNLASPLTNSLPSFRHSAFGLLLLGSLFFCNTLWSQEARPSAEGAEEASEIEEYTLEELVVVGTRHAPRSVEESAAPIDVLSPADLRGQASVTLDDILRTLVPSFNVQRHGIDDEATLVRPVTLRGLPPDNLLVLVNGKRRHRSGVIALLGSSLNTGSQGPDLSVFHRSQLNKWNFCETAQLLSTAPMPSPECST